jgi:hypothetical protein
MWCEEVGNLPISWRMRGAAALCFLGWGVACMHACMQHNMNDTDLVEGSVISPHVMQTHE